MLYSRALPQVRSASTRSAELSRTSNFMKDCLVRSTADHRAGGATGSAFEADLLRLGARGEKLARVTGTCRGFKVLIEL